MHVSRRLFRLNSVMILYMWIVFVEIIEELHEKLVANVTIKLKCVGKWSKDSFFVQESFLIDPMEKPIVTIVIWWNQANWLNSNKNQWLKSSNVNHAIQVDDSSKKAIWNNRLIRYLAPEITLPPMNVANRTGSNVYLTCEVAGVPLPVVEWVYTSATGKQTVYPSKMSVFSE